MFGLRLILFIGIALCVFALLGYSVSRDRRYITLLGIIVKGTLAIAVLLLILLVLGRYVAL